VHFGLGGALRRRDAICPSTRVAVASARLIARSAQTLPPYPHAA
jgi:hypothetical protein